MEYRRCRCGRAFDPRSSTNLCRAGRGGTYGPHSCEITHSFASAGTIRRMSNIASALKAEISRIAKKEIKAETQALKSASTKYRSDIATLKRQVAALQKDLKLASGTDSRPGRTAQQEPSGTGHRFSAKGLAS